MAPTIPTSPKRARLSATSPVKIDQTKSGIYKTLDASNDVRNLILSNYEGVHSAHLAVYIFRFFIDSTTCHLFTKVEVDDRWVLRTPR